jgi:hypothetical protein
MLHEVPLPWHLKAIKRKRKSVSAQDIEITLRRQKHGHTFLHSKINAEAMRKRWKEEKLREAEWQKDVLAKRRGRDNKTLKDAERRSKTDAMRRRRVEEQGEETLNRDVENRRQRREDETE